MNARYLPWIALVAAAWMFTGCFGNRQAGPSPEPVEKTQAPALKTGDLAPNHLALARDLADNNFYEVALVQLKAAMEKQGGNAMVYDLAGVCARETGDHKTGEAYFKKALALSPKSASVHNNLGILYALTNEMEKAGQSFRQAVILDPGRADYMNNLGYLHLSQKQYADAEQAFQSALELSPGYEPAVNNLAISLGMQHKDGRAMDLLLSRYDTDTAWHNMACIYTMRNEPDKARQLRKFSHTSAGKSNTDPFAVQTGKHKTGQSKGNGLPGDAANLIYTKKYQPAMKSDPDGLGDISGDE